MSFLHTPPPTAEGRALFDQDLHEIGFVMNASRLWAYAPSWNDALFDVLDEAVRVARLSPRQKAVVVCATTASLGDSYCSTVYGGRLAAVAEPDLAAAVLRGEDALLTAQEQALAGWARAIVRSPNETSPADVEVLRTAGFGDDQIFAITTFVALRIAFATVNDSLGARPDGELLARTPEAVLKAVSFGRPIDDRSE